MRDEGLRGTESLAGSINTPAWPSGYRVWFMRGCCTVQQKPGSELLE